ncbi:uncharacterized protein LOC126970188 [Leptidea sinapis]|uniref:uncharacterized protein LOC126970188 n=1 Tax=Leptidea sinapis TaxID=189913 RepID=UPI0021C48606|nr:uncharacterized protein LOC126970188 [Leptidea sinapis]
MTFSTPERFDKKLLQLVKENPVLYDHNHAKYMDFNSREVAWQKIGDELKRPAADCKVRWVNIRDVYRRILKQKINKRGQKKSYKYEREMSFMRPYYKDIKIVIEKAETDEECDQNDEADNDDRCSAYSDEPILRPKIEKVSKRESKRKKHMKEFVDVEDTVMHSYNEPGIQTEFDSSDPVDAFLLSIGATLKSFSPYHLNVAKSKIFSIVQEHDLQQIVQKQQGNEIGPQETKMISSSEIFMQ